MFLNKHKKLKEHDKNMTRTLFDIIIKNNDFNYYTSPSKRIFSSWTINSLLQEINPILDEEEIISLRNIHLFLRTIIDPRIKKTYSLEERINAIKIAKNAMIQEHTEEDKKEYEKILEKLKKHKRKKIDYPYDQITLLSSNPLLTERTAKKIIKEYEDNITIIALANGAILPGLDLYHKTLRIKTAQTEQNNLYFIRYSTQKMQDKKPKIDDEEKDYITTLGKKTQIILFDEDVSTGITLISAKNYFKRHLGVKVRLATNSLSYIHTVLPEELKGIITAYKYD